MKKETFVDGMFDLMLDQNLLYNPAKNTIKITKKGIFYWNVLNEIIKRDKVDTNI